MNTDHTFHLEKAKDLQKNHIIIDSMAPNVLSEFVMTPEMIKYAKKLQKEGKKRSEICSKLSDFLLNSCEKDSQTRKSYLEYWDRSGVGVCHNTLYAFGPPETAWDSLINEFSRFNRLMNSMDGKIIQAGSSKDIVFAKQHGLKSVIQNIQSPEPIGENFDRVDVLYGLGLRSMQLTYNLRSRFAEGCLERNDGGLSRFGVSLIEKLNHSNIMVDVSHGSPLTAYDSATVSVKPIIASHTAAHALSKHARALPDKSIKAIADRGGYIGVLMLPAFIIPADGDGRAEKFGKPKGWATLDSVVDHVEYILNLAGEDHIGIGTDWGKPYYNALTWTSDMINESKQGFDWVAWRPQDRFDPNMQVLGMETWDMWPNLIAALLSRGISEKVVLKIIGGNFLRVFQEVCG